MARIYFAVITTLILVASGYAVYMDFSPEWKAYQKEYYQLLASYEADVNRADQISKTRPSIKQIYDADYGIVDRCITCHTSYSDPQFEKEPHPFHTHPEKIVRDHPVDKFGCVVCHDGNGHATSVEAAHGREKHSEKPLLTGVWVQSRCVRCHQGANEKGMEELKRGFSLIDRAACFACHDLGDFPIRERVAPTLDGIGSKVHGEWLKRWIMAPQEYLRDTLMPDYHLDNNRALAITAYLMTLKSPGLTGSSMTRPASIDSAQARQILKRGACDDCHSFSGGVAFEGIAAPDLSRIGEKAIPEWLSAWLREPEHFQPGTLMPGFSLDESEATSLAHYLIDTYAGGDARQRPGQENRALLAELARPELVEQGKELVDELGCLSCHAIEGAKSHSRIGPDLGLLGDWDKHHLEWGEVEHTHDMGLRDFVRLKVEAPLGFSKDARMPDFHFSKEDLEAITVALLSFSTNPLPMEAQVSQEIPRSTAASPSGEIGRIFKRYQCLTCHEIGGRYGRMAPDLSFEGDKVQEHWLAEYLRTPHVIRPLTEQRMPGFGMSEREIRLVTGFMALAWRDDRVPDDPFPDKLPPKSLIERGRSLYLNDYACTECHTINGEGEEIGPALDRVGARLRAGWIYQWLLDPQAFYENEMTNEDIPAQDALALTAYMLTLK